MKRIKKILASLMVVVMVLTAAPLSGFVGMELNLDWLDFTPKASAASYSGTCGDNLTWSLDTESGELVINGEGEMKAFIYSSPPWYRYQSSIKKVTIGDGVTSIGNYAFSSCTSLTSVTIPDSVTSIGNSAFYDCTSLTSITIPDSVTSIGYSAFYYCTSLTSITIPDSVTNIGDSTFYNCKSLTSITISDSVTSIGDRAFYNCKSLTSITIPDSVTGIGDYAFCFCASLTSITIPNSVTSIGNYAFSDCTSLTNITIPDSVTSIGDSMFSSCRSLTSITIPDSVTSIGSYAFHDCTSLTSITVAEGNTAYSSDECGVLFNKDKTELIQYPIGNERTSYTIPDSVTSIGGRAFYGCTSLTSITIPDSVTSIGSTAFSGCTSLTNITIPDSVTSIGDSAFYNCTSLKSITIPDSVTSIGDYAFNGCNTAKVYYTGTKDKWNSITLGSSIGLNTIVFECNSERPYYDLGKCGDNLDWILYSDDELVISGTGVMESYESASYVPWDSYRSLIKKVTIADGVTSISGGAFYECTSLTSATIGNGVTSIDRYAFQDCTSLTSVTIGNGVKSIGSGAFYNCDNLTSITIPDSVTSIRDYAFNDCGKLEKVIFKRSDYIELGTDFLVYSPNAMICCEEGSYLHAYTEVNNMKVCLFDENGVPSFVVQNDVLLSYRGESKDVFVSAGTKIGYGAFENNSVVETVVLSSSVSRIHANAFRNCSSLETVIIPESVTSIAAGAFDGSDDLTIWCYAGSYADSYATANGINVEYIALDIEKDILILTLGEPSSLTASLNTPYAENSGVVWSSTNTSIATVDGNGNVKGIKAGTAVIVATSKDGGLRDYCVVKVVGIEALSTATIDHENGIIMGLSSNLDSLDGYVEISDPACNLSYDSLGTDSIVYVECDGEIVDAYTILVYGDVNGDSWYDGQDAVLVSCLANGMLTKDDVSEAVYMAADCNHDGVIDQADVALLNEAGTLLASVDQSKPAEVLLETSAEYVEYLDLIDQSPELDIEDETDTPEVDVEDTPEADTEDAKIDIFEMIMNFIESIFEMLLSYIPMPLK